MADPINARIYQEDHLDLAINEAHANDINDLTLVNKLLTTKHINNKAIHAVLSSAWNLGHNVEIKHDHNLVTCTFLNAKDRDRILELDGERCHTQSDQMAPTLDSSGTIFLPLPPSGSSFIMSHQIA